MPAYRVPPLLAKLTLMSAVVGPPDGTIVRSCQLRPPSLDTKTGALEPPSGSGVNAVAMIVAGFPGSTAIFGSLSWRVSPLRKAGVILTMISTAGSPSLAPDKVQLEAGLEIHSV